MMINTDWGWGKFWVVVGPRYENGFDIAVLLVVVADMVTKPFS